MTRLAAPDAGVAIAVKKAPALVEVGALLGGKYKVERVIAEGGMGVVVRAINVDLKTQVAIKVLHPDLKDDHSAFQRFLQEARGVAKLKSDHIVQMLDVNAFDGQLPYMVMELLDGVDLDTMVQLQGHIASSTAVAFIREACAGVEVAHKAGILHRDLKPANLFLARKGSGSAVIKVLDFGLMKIKPEGGEDVKITRPKDVFGTPSYMSPEQISAEILDERTDVWSLGAILYELVTGRSAFGAETIAQTLVNISIHQPPPMDTFAEDVPEGLQDVVKKCLAKDRAERYATVEELSAALKPFAKDDANGRALLPDRPVSIAPPPPKPPPRTDKELIATLQLPKGEKRDSMTTMSLLDRDEDDEPEKKEKSSNALLYAILAGAALGGILALIFISTGGDSNAKPAPSASDSASIVPLSSSESPPRDTVPVESDSLPHMNVRDLPSATVPERTAPPPVMPNGTSNPTPSTKPVTTALPERPQAPPSASPSVAPYPEFGRRK